MSDITIRQAGEQDFEALYALGLATPEFRVSASEPFMEPEEFRASLMNRTGAMFLAEHAGEAAGFIYACWADLERAPGSPWACLVYLTVRGDYRKQGIARMLYEACVVFLKQHGMKKIYGWASAESDGAIVAFMKKQGFAEGHRYTWMDKTL